jgi:predicted AAA+ superfamily ATPase
MIAISQLKQILTDQKNEISRLLSSSMIARTAELVIEPELADNLVKVITGVRRCGKSIMAHRLLKDKTYAYVNFDDERLIDVKAETLNDLLEVLKEINPGFDYVLLDEIQNVVGWELFVNRLQRNGLKVVITGSNAHLLSKELATHLTGRHRVFEVFPFSFREYLAYKKIKLPGATGYATDDRAVLKGAFEEYALEGGFPEIYTVVNKSRYLQDLYEKIITRDIATRHGLRYLKTLKELAVYVAGNYSSKISYQKLKNIFELGSVHTVKNYLDYMEDAYLFSLVSHFSFKVKEQIRRPRKVYGIDTGLVRAVTTIGPKNTGRILENIVYLELRRRQLEIHFYVDDRNKYEVDFVIKNRVSGKYQLIQVCADVSNMETHAREIKSLLYAAKVLEVERMLVLTANDAHLETVSEKVIEYVPVWEWLLQSEMP